LSKNDTQDTRNNPRSPTGWAPGPNSAQPLPANGGGNSIHPALRGAFNGDITPMTRIIERMRDFPANGPAQRDIGTRRS
jgi:hypothetical protein